MTTVQLLLLLATILFVGGILAPEDEGGCVCAALACVLTGVAIFLWLT